MARMLASFLAVLLALGGTLHARSPQEDPLLTAYYNGNEAVLCRDYHTANGARFATYQWWLLGFVSGASHGSKTTKRPLPRTDVARVLKLASDHCRERPMDTLASAAIAVVAKLGAGRSGR